MEKLIALIESEAAISYKIKSKAGLLMHRTAENPEELSDQLESDYESLDNGFYTFYVGSDHRFRESKAETLTFKIGQASQYQKPINSMNIDIEKIKKDAYEQGFKDAQIEIIKHRLDAIEKKHEEFVKIVSRKFDELEGDDDDDVIAKVTKIASNIGEAKQAMEGFRA